MNTRTFVDDDTDADPRALLERCQRAEDRLARLQATYDRLQELDRLKSDFLATVSHELRTPLTSILGYSEMLLEGIAGELRPEQAEFVRTIHEKSDHLLTLILGILDLSKLEHGTMPMRRTAVRIDAVLNDVRSTLAPNAHRGGVSLQVDAPSDLPELRADPDRLRQVFANLGDNAIKFTPAGGTVLFVARPLGTERIEVRVVDTGIGIPVRERGRVFDPFYQVETTRAHGGAGLGLAIVKRLVEALGGVVRIEGNVPVGTTFVVTLPTHDGPASTRRGGGAP